MTEEKEEHTPELTITEEALRSNQRQLTDIIEFLPDATLAIDTEKRVIIWNKAIEEMTGISASEMIGKGDYVYTIPFYGEARPHLTDLIFQDDEKIVNRYYKVNREGDSFTAEVFCSALNNNKGAWVFAKVSPLHDQAGNMIGAIESIRDITEAKNKEKLKELNTQLEYRVSERTAQLESVNKELEALSYSISHDLKAPLRHMTGYVSLLVKKYSDLLPEEGHHYLDMISVSVGNMGELIDGLLQFSRSGRIEMNQKLLNMNEIVAAIIQPIKEQAIERRIEFNIEPMPLVFGDPDMIKSVWSNLIENAVKFSEKKDLTKISIGAEENENDIVYYVKDNGAGFDMNYAAKLFTVFQRLHSREDYEGTGIGLATVQRIITRHGGKIWAESKAGEGATFYFSLTKRKESEKTC